MVDANDVMELIRAYQGELDLSHCCIRRLERSSLLLEEIAADVNEYIVDNNLQDATLGKYDSHTDAIVEIVRKKLEL